MKPWVIALGVLAAGAANAADWRDDLKIIQAGAFPPPRSQHAVYRFGWGKLAAAEATIDFARQEKDQLQLTLTAKTTGAVRVLWRLDALHTAVCDAATLRPRWLEQTERYRKETEKTKVDFFPDELVRLAETQPPDKVAPRPKRFKFPNVTDLQTALLLVRSQPLQKGDRYSLVVYPSRTAYLARIEVFGQESLKLNGQNRPAVKMQVSLQHITKNLALEPHSKFKNAFAWFSDDADRLLLKIKSEVFVGSVSLELQSVKFTGD